MSNDSPIKTIVAKFGGSSLADINSIRFVAQKIYKLQKEYQKLVIVVSAMYKDTDRLEELSKNFTIKDNDEPNAKIATDIVVSTGEQISSGLLSLALWEIGKSNVVLQGWQVPIITSPDSGNARIESIESKNILKNLNAGKIVIVPGFQGISKQGYITTLGRGGSDISAVAIAAALKSDYCHLYKDVDGVLAGDPKLIDNPKILNRISIAEMLEKSSLGAQVIQSRAVECALNNNVSLKILPTFNDGDGTIIANKKNDFKTIERTSIAGIVCNDSEVKISIHEISNSPEIISKVFAALSNSKINIDMVTQEQGMNSQLQILSFTINERYFEQVQKIIKKLHSKIKYTELTSFPKIAKVSIVGSGLRGNINSITIVYDTLAKMGIRSYGVVSNELRLSILLSAEYAPNFVKILYKKLNL